MLPLQQPQLQLPLQPLPLQPLCLFHLVHVLQQLLQNWSVPRSLQELQPRLLVERSRPSLAETRGHGRELRAEVQLRRRVVQHHLLHF